LGIISASNEVWAEAKFIIPRLVKNKHRNLDFKFIGCDSVIGKMRNQLPNLKEPKKETLYLLNRWDRIQRF
jgi:hypothetical protein